MYVVFFVMFFSSLILLKALVLVPKFDSRIIVGDQRLEFFKVFLGRVV